MGIDARMSLHGHARLSAKPHSSAQFISPRSAGLSKRGLLPGGRRSSLRASTAVSARMARSLAAAYYQTQVACLQLGQVVDSNKSLER